MGAEQHQKVRPREGRTCRRVVKPNPPFTGGETEARELGVEGLARHHTAEPELLKAGTPDSESGPFAPGVHFLQCILGEERKALG